MKNLKLGIGSGGSGPRFSSTVSVYQQNIYTGGAMHVLDYSGSDTAISTNTLAIWGGTNGISPPIASGGGIVCKPATTNVLANPFAPVDQTTGSLTTGTYTAWCYGSGSFAVSANTATITGAGSATESTPLNFVVNVAGTVDVTITGSLTSFQIVKNSFKTPIVSGISSATVLTCPMPSVVKSSYGMAVDFTFIPNGGGTSTQVLLSAGAVSSTRWNVYLESGKIFASNTNGGVVSFPSQTLPAGFANTLCRSQVYFDVASKTGGVRCELSSGDITAKAFSIDIDASLTFTPQTTFRVGEQFGSFNFNGYFGNEIKFYRSKADAGW